MCWISVKILLGIKKLDVLELIQRITVHVIAGIYIKVHVVIGLTIVFSCIGMKNKYRMRRNVFWCRLHALTFNG